MERQERHKRSDRLHLARVLVVDDNLTSRLTLKTLLEAGGYRVDSASTATEAADKLDRGEYQLVLSDLQMGVLAYAQAMTYKPATAIIHSEHSDVPDQKLGSFLVSPEDVPGLLGKVANLIAGRVNRQLKRTLRQSPN